MGEWTLGIDFGTSYTTGAVLRDGTVQPLEIENSRYVRSLVHLDDTGELLVGRAAANREEAFPERTERCPKRAMVTGSSVRLAGTDVTVTALVAAVYRRVATEARLLQGGPPAALVLTHPARWGEAELGVLRAAAAEAGLPAPWFVPEPVAAAGYYAVGGRIPEGRCVAVYDLGGGTFDTAVLRRVGGRFEQVGAPGGHPRLGGEDFDEELLGLVARHAAAADADAWDALAHGTGRAHRRRWTRLRKDVTDAKHELSESLTGQVLPDGFDDEIRLTRAEFEAGIAPRVAESMAELRATVERAGVAFADLAEVFLTGGSSRVPLIGDVFARTFDRLPAVEGDPKGVVVLGALHTYRAATAPDAPPAALPQAAAAGNGTAAPLPFATGPHPAAAPPGTAAPQPTAAAASHPATAPPGAQGPDPATAPVSTAPSGAGGGQPPAADPATAPPGAAGPRPSPADVFRRDRPAAPKRRLSRRHLPLAAVAAALVLVVGGVAVAQNRGDEPSSSDGTSQYTDTTTDTGGTDTGGTTDTGDTGDSGDATDTGDTGDSGDLGDTGDTGGETDGGGEECTEGCGDYIDPNDCTLTDTCSEDTGDGPVTYDEDEDGDVWSEEDNDAYFEDQ